MRPPKNTRPGRYTRAVVLRALTLTHISFLFVGPTDASATRGIPPLTGSIRSGAASFPAAATAAAARTLASKGSPPAAAQPQANGGHDKNYDQ